MTEKNDIIFQFKNDFKSMAPGFFGTLFFGFLIVFALLKSDDVLPFVIVASLFIILFLGRIIFSIRLYSDRIEMFSLLGKRTKIFNEINFIGYSYGQFSFVKRRNEYTVFGVIIDPDSENVCRLFNYIKTEYPHIKFVNIIVTEDKVKIVRENR